MLSLLLAIIYLSFISLGLPDSLLGAAWPVMRLDIGSSVSAAGTISMVIAGGTIISSLASDRVTRRFGTGTVTAVSVAATAAALWGFSAADHAWELFVWAVPYGLGAGAIDAALNNYVALHYSARHMSWLHCFWGVGASVSPYIMSFSISTRFGWSGGFGIIAVLQAVISLLLFLSLPLWKSGERETGEGSASPGIAGVLKIRGVPAVLVSFFCYCGMETSCGLWASSYLAEYRLLDGETSAMFASLFYLGITFGRFLNGFAADRIGSKVLIRIGCAVVFSGIALMLIPFPGNAPALAGLVIAGLGCAPVYPSIIHSTPQNFGAENSQAIVGIQMAFAYFGSTFMPPLFGIIAQHISMSLYPVFLAVFAAGLFLMTERLNSLMRLKSPSALPKK